MSISDSWQCLSVAEFWQIYNWTGELLLQEKLSSVEELQFEYVEAWQHLSVEVFFASSNWDNQSKLSSKQPKNIIFSTALSVTYFWQCFIWQGQKRVNTLVNNNTIPVSSTDVNTMPKKQINLAELSQLF